jgi:acyl carrier protein
VNVELRRQVSSIIVSQLDIRAEEVQDPTFLSALPGIDSMRVLQIILALEKEFGIEIEDKATFRLETVGELQCLVEELVEVRKSA